MASAQPPAVSRGCLPDAVARPSLAWLLLAAVCHRVAGVCGSGNSPHGGRLIRLLAPPTVDPAGALTFWNNLIPLLRPAWKRSLFGQPHLSFEINADAGGLRFAIWTPDAVPPAMVEQAIEAAWPGARTTTQEATPPLPEQAAATGGRLRLARPDALPLKTDHPADPLRPLLGALSGIGEHQAACIQLLARPVTGRRLTRLRTATKRRRAVAQSAPGKPTPTPDPFRASELAGMVTKAASPAYAVELRYAAATLAPATDKTTAKWEAKVRRGQAHAIASAFASYTGLNGLVRRPLRHSPLPARRPAPWPRATHVRRRSRRARPPPPRRQRPRAVTRAGTRAVNAPPAIPTVKPTPTARIRGWPATSTPTSSRRLPVTPCSFPSTPLTSTDGNSGSRSTGRHGPFRQFSIRAD